MELAGCLGFLLFDGETDMMVVTVGFVVGMDGADRGRLSVALSG